MTDVAKSRDDGIDGLRALAVTMVVLHHFTYRWTAEQLHFASPVGVGVPFGSLGVDLFFVISGYCIAMTAERAPNARTFWLRRLSRIIPAFTVCVLITALATRVLDPVRAPASWSAVGANLLWLPAFSSHVPMVDGAYWTLIVEMKFYLLFAIMLAAGRSPRNATWIFIGFVVIGYALWIAQPVLPLKPKVMSNLFKQNLIFPYGLFFALGLTLRLMNNRWLHAGIIVASLVTMWPQGQDGVLLVLLVLAAVVLTRRDISLPRFVTYIGFISYPIYLLHQDAGVALLRSLAATVPWSYPRIALVIAVIVATAALVSVLVEHRFRRRLESLLAFVLRVPAPVHKPTTPTEAATVVAHS